jgi:serine phosphatase RsbU (regulator of sigma subunit)
VTDTPAATASAAIAAPPAPPAPIGAPAVKVLLAWAFAWAVVGTLIAAGITFTRQALDLWPVLRVSVLFAEVVGFTALLSARMVFPLFSGLPQVVNVGLQVLTLLSGTVFGSAMVVISQPLFSLARLRIVAMIVVVNAVFAVGVGLALYTYDSMRRQIEASYRRLRRQEAMERQLEIAREVQRELLPATFPTLPGFELAGACNPAIGVGGDYYDFLPFGDDVIGLVIADVSGKGIPAAMWMAGLQANFRSLAATTISPGEVNTRLNTLLYRSALSARYATLFFGRYDARRRVLTYSNAGHYPPLHLGADRVGRLAANGRPIGLLHGSRYDEGRRELREGDILALYTDGITEAFDPGGQEFGEARLLDLLVRNRHRDLSEIVLTVLQELDRWTGGGPAGDDATLVLGRAR